MTGGFRYQRHSKGIKCVRHHFKPHNNMSGVIYIYSPYIVFMAGSPIVVAMHRIVLFIEQIQSYFDGFGGFSRWQKSGLFYKQLIFIGFELY